MTEYGATDVNGTATVVPGSSDARVTVIGNVDSARNGITAAWLVKRITDTFQNFIQFDYGQEAVLKGTGPDGVTVAGKEWYIKKARYTPGSNGTVNEIEFVYNNGTGNADPFDNYPRVDVAEAYHAGNKVSQARLLRKVVVRNNGVVIREYRITHRASVSTGLPLVSKVQECNAAGACLPATTFEYRDASAAASMSRTLVTSFTAADLDGTDRGVLTGDFNGDGRTDIIRWHTDPSQNKLYLASDKSVGSFSQLTSGFDFAAHYLGGSGVTTHVVDVNGDGLADLVRTCADSAKCPYISVWLSKGDGTFKNVPSFTPAANLMSSYSSSTRRCGFDENGQPYYAGSSTTKSVFFQDVDGDGRLDILSTQNTYGTGCGDGGNEPLPGTVSGVFYKGVGNGQFTETASSFNWSQFPSGLPKETLRGTDLVSLTDVNGDGLPDLLSSGVGLNLGGVAGFANSSANFIKSGLSIRVPVDINGDGLIDVIVSGDTDTYKDADPWLFINKGDGTFQKDNRALVNIKADSTFRFGSGQLGSMTMDVNADGLADFVAWDNQGNPTVWFAKRATTGLVTYVKDASGNAHGIPNLFSKFFGGDFSGVGDNSLLTIINGDIYLYRTDAAKGADLMSAAVSGAGARTQVSYQTLSQAASTAVYAVGRAVSAAPESFNPDTTAISIAPAQWVVSSTKQPSAVPPPTGSSTPPYVESVFMYQGMKAALGRGSLGFQIVTKYYPFASGELMVNTTEYHQNPAQFQYLGQPIYNSTYTGLSIYNVTQTAKAGACAVILTKTSAEDCESSAVTVTTKTFNPVASISGLKLLSRTDYAYCDLTKSLTTAVTFAPPAAGSTYGAPCAATARIRRPFQAQSIERQYDLDGSLVSEKLTTNLEMSAYGDPKQTIVKLSAPDVAGQSGWYSTRQTLNTYGADDISDGKWFLGRITQAKVTSTVNAPQPTKTAGTAPNATAVSGGPATPPPSPPISPAVLATIMELLLSDD